MSDLIGFSSVVPVARRRLSWLSHAFRPLRRSAPPEGDLPRIDVDRWSPAMLRDIGLDGLEAGRNADPRRTPMDWRLR